MKLKIFITCFSIIILSGEIIAQQKYWVFLKDKEGVTFNPYEYFTEKTIERRLLLGISLSGFDDLPLNSNYCNALSEISEIKVKSRWLNAVSMELNSSELKKVKELDFVSDVDRIKSVVREAGKNKDEEPGEKLNHIAKQRTIMGVDHFEKMGLNGKGVRIAVFDGGFPGVDTLAAFEKIRQEGRIIATWDFVKNKEYVYDYSSHGTSVLACIAGFSEGVNIGLGSGAEFLLARTEVTAEVFSEEENWAAAVEWADKNGADIISSSLGYTYHRYFPKQMDGKHTFITRMANRAAGKGMLVINAAGNDGDSEWQVIGAPADADSVLSVGGINSNNLAHSGFSSFGPTYDGRMKPNVVAFSDVVTVNKNGELTLSYGTSFSAPLITGFAACVKQMHPEWDNMKIFNEICKSGHLYPYFDYATGYGIPQASYFMGLPEEVEPTFSLSENEGVLLINLLPLPVDTTRKVFVRLAEGGPENSTKIISSEEGDRYVVVSPPDNYPSGVEQLQSERGYKFDDNYLYFHMMDRESGKIRRYKVIKISGYSEYKIALDELKDTELLRIHYKGYTTTFTP